MADLGGGWKQKHSYNLTRTDDHQKMMVTYTLRDHYTTIYAVRLPIETLHKWEDELGGAGTGLMMAFEPAFICDPQARSLLVELVKQGKTSANKVVFGKGPTKLGELEALKEKAEDAATVMQNVANSVPGTLSALVKKHDVPLEKLAKKEVETNHSGSIPSKNYDTKQLFDTLETKKPKPVKAKHSGGPPKLSPGSGFNYWYDKYGNIQAKPSKPLSSGGIIKAKPVEHSSPFGTDSGAQHPATNQLPGIGVTVKHPVTGVNRKLMDVIIDLNDNHGWTREKIADWIEEAVDIDKISFKVNTD